MFGTTYQEWDQGWGIQYIHTVHKMSIQFTFQVDAQSASSKCVQYSPCDDKGWAAKFPTRILC